jgi:1,2-diacylglycerol 3-beta-glucosyltransferase
MNIVIIIINLVLLAVVGGMLFYLFALSLLACIGRLLPAVQPSSGRRFAVVIPAHNEETSIARTVRSFHRVDYPRDRYDLIVIADNCTDATASVARAEGATVMERANDTLKSKGYALRWCFDRILAGSAQPRYDAVIVVDADSVVSANFISVMNAYLDRGARVIQSNDMVEPQPGVWSAEIIRFGFTLYNHVRPLARRVVSFSAGLRGNGMCFSADVLREVPWCTYGLNEDLEFGIILLLRGIRSEFAREATVLATMPANPKNAESQRARWEKGRFPVVGTYAPKLLRNILLRGSVRSLDALIDLVMPPFVNLFGLAILLFILNAGGALLGFGVAAAMLPWWIAAVAAGTLHVFVGLFAADADAGLYKTLFVIPRYALWKIVLYVRMMLRGTSGEWIRTTREAGVKSGESD